MRDHDDELSRLRDADPADRASIVSPDAPGPRALRERIMMNPTTSGSRRMPFVAAAAAVLLLVGGGAVLASRGDEKPKHPSAGTKTPGNTTSGSCVELFSLQTLASREVAFDGTVTSVSGDNVTLKVNESFHGVNGQTITLKGASTFGGGGGAITSAGDGVTLETGNRLLVSGDGGFMWACGFTSAYSADTAADWRTTFKK